MRNYRESTNLVAFLVGFTFIVLLATTPSVYAAPADNLTESTFLTGVAETQQILTGIASTLMFGLGVVAGRFR